MKPKLLCIDDTLGAKSTWKKILKEHVEITEAIGGFEAVKKIERDVFSLVIVNISSKHLKGVEAILRIRSEGITLPVIVLYDKHDVLDLKQAKLYGIQAFFPFPLEMKKFISEINRYIPEKSSQAGGKDKVSRRTAQAQKTSGSSKQDFVNIEEEYYEGLSAISANNLRKAIALFEDLLKITRIKKESWRRYLEDARFKLGQCYGAIGEYEKSNHYYSSFISVAPHNANHKPALLYMGKNYLAQKKNEKAAACFNKVIHMRPYDSYSTQARKLLKKVTPAK